LLTISFLDYSGNKAYCRLMTGAVAGGTAAGALPLTQVRTKYCYSLPSCI
jgi:hypothetical protein